MRIFELTEFINLKFKDLRHQVANIKGLENQIFFKKNPVSLYENYSEKLSLPVLFKLKKFYLNIKKY